MSLVDFKPWPKIPRDNPFNVTITEKIDGTNACIIIQDGQIVGVQSRRRFIYQHADNYGFAGWVSRNEEELLKLGEGYHYGEWAGIGIQGNPHNLPDKQFFLFNTFRWNKSNPNLPWCCQVVPVLFEGRMSSETIPTVMAELQDNAAQGVTPEGVAVYYHAHRSYTKHTFKSPNGKWCKG